MTSSNDLLSKANIMRFSTQLVDNMLEKRKKDRISEDSFNSEIDGIFDQDREDTITGFKIVKNAQHFRDRRKKMNTKFNSLSPKEKLKLNELNSTAYLDLNSIINSAPRAFPKASDELKWSFDTWGNFIMHELKSITKDADDWHAFGKNNKDSNECSINLAALGFKLLNNKNPNCSDPDKALLECCCATISSKTVMKELAQIEKFTNHLITEEDLKQGFRCDIKIARSVFPHIANESFFSDFDDDSGCYENQ